AEALAGKLPSAITWQDALGSEPADDIEFVPVAFNDPLYILFSSGTTGAPKCIVHSVGGVLIQHLKEHQLQCDIRPGDKLFYFTTCGWMMWNWLATALACEATLCLYDGSPFYPDGNVLFDYADEERFDIFGTSAKYIDSLKKGGFNPRQSHDLGSLRLILSTGSPLAPESFDYVYDAIKTDVQLSSMSGGTDICGCFVGGQPTGPVWRGEIQASMLGMAVDVWEDEGKRLNLGKGELVCTQPFPSMPIGFLNDPDGEKYRSAYFDRFDNVWCQGDFAEWTEHGGLIIHGRSDATLNPGGVRIGTAEIYAQVEQMPEIVEAIAVGQSWDNDVRIILFVRLADGVTLTDDLIKAVKQKIRSGASPRHVPAKVLSVRDIPRTKSGKITEIAVRDIVHGREVRNKEALANPEALELFRDLAELET
ncbi:MAG: acetoacetate--CoA ligase, partial [Fimbriimonadaceae bacterium]|nr:acetoacetate--CoA ligase [Alphaproteobacteria bacterium]